MLVRMLGRHSAVTAFQELHFVEELWLPAVDTTLGIAGTLAALADRLLHNQFAWYHDRFEPGRFEEQAYAAVRGLVAPIRATTVSEAVLRTVCVDAGTSVAVEQTPRSVLHLQELLDAVPDSRAVVTPQVS